MSTYETFPPSPPYQQESHLQPFYMQDLPDDAIVLPPPLPPKGALNAPSTSWDEGRNRVQQPTAASSLSRKRLSTSSRVSRVSNYAEYGVDGRGLTSSAKLAPDGRIGLSLNLKKALPDLPDGYATEVHEFAVDEVRWRDVPRLHIVIMIVGSRGDVQPYVALGKMLKADGHRIRIATHKAFDQFVTEAGMEFFDIGGNPQDLMSYMVKNPGLVPGMESILNGDIKRKREMLEEMILGCWDACTTPNEPGDLTPFVVDAIISNPPAFAHVHCAEALGIPLQLSFTMPWSPTTAFNHPLVNVKKSNAEPKITNYLSYTAAELLTWQGIGDIINEFRTETLGLPPLSLRSGPGIQDRLRVPWTYCMSPALVPKPPDWKGHIDVVGFYFLDLASNYQPPRALVDFFNAGPRPIYIGFGSIVVDDPAALTKTIFQATKMAGVRALLSAGWGGFGGIDVPDHIFILGNVPHDWLFGEERVAAVVHHGGAGTTAIGLAKGRPTVVVPFFGDQQFWGDMIHKAGAGPKPIPHKELTVYNLSDAITYAVSEEARLAARDLADRIRSEDGVRGGVDSFYRHLPLLNMRCDLDPTRTAVWWSTKYCLKLSAFAVQVLLDAQQITMQDLELHRTKEHHSKSRVSDPLTGGASAVFWTVTHYTMGIAQLFYSPANGVVNTTTAIPEGMMRIVNDIYEGFHNVPSLYGSSVRERGKITGVASGFREAGKGFFYGYYDAITGLVREPIVGAQREGWKGALKGSARSFVDTAMKPAAGSLGLVTLPAQGLWREYRSPTSREGDRSRLLARIAQGHEAVRACRDENQKREVLQRFREATTEARIKGRRGKYMKKAEDTILEGLDEEERSENASKPRRESYERGGDFAGGQAARGSGGSGGGSGSGGVEERPYYSHEEHRGSWREKVRSQIRSRSSLSVADSVSTSTSTPTSSLSSGQRGLISGAESGHAHQRPRSWNRKDWGEILESVAERLLR